jgi:integrase
MSVIRASLAPKPRTAESACTTAAKRWIPWLCAFSGARVAEIAQLRKVDIRLDETIQHGRITSDAGSVKTGLFVTCHCIRS